LWDLVTRQELAAFPVGEARVTAVAFVPGIPGLAVGTKGDSTLRLLDGVPLPVATLAAEGPAPAEATVSYDKMNRPYGPEQATGPPDTWPRPGDSSAAWCPATTTGADWLLLEYARPVEARAVHVYETCSPGGVYKVSLFTAEGREVVAWQGRDPTPPGSGKGISRIPVKGDFKTRRVKIYLHSRAVQGWKEIDAVGLVDAGGQTQWAVAAAASSSWGKGAVGSLVARSSGAGGGTKGGRPWPARRGGAARPEPRGSRAWGPE